MKARNFTAIFSITLMFVFFGCTPDSSVAPTTEDVLVKNMWSVDYYYHTQDMTSEFNPSRILFSSTGAVAYQKNGVTIPGTWSKVVDASGNELVNLNFNTSDGSISRLNESWKIIDRTSTYFQFEESTGVLFRIKVQ